MDEHMDDVELRTEIQEATDRALDLADELAVEAVSHPAASLKVASLAAGYQEQRLLVRRLRRALTAMVAG